MGQERKRIYCIPDQEKLLQNELDSPVEYFPAKI